MSRTLLVVGGTGFLGIHLLRAAEDAGFQPVCAARRPSSLVFGSFRALDATDLGDVERALDEIEPRGIVFAAAMARIADCEREPARARRLNAEVPGEVATIARERGLRLVHVSTDLVFGSRRAPTSGFTEIDEPAPVSVYGVTKAAGERGVLDAYPAALVVRLPLLCGDSHGRGLGASDSVVASVARSERPRLFVDEWRTPIDVAVAARALVELVDSDLHGLLHVAGPARMDRHELGLRALRVARHADPGALVEAAERSGEHGPRPPDVSLDASRARALLRTLLVEPFA